MATFADDTLPGEWPIADLAVHLRSDTPHVDAQVIRVLAARIAAAGPDNEDPTSTLTDLARALDSLGVAVAALVEDPEDDGAPEAGTVYSADVIKHLHAATLGMETLAS